MEFHPTHIPNFWVTRNGIVLNKKTDRIRKASLNPDGYLQFSYYEKGKTKTEYIHRIVGRAFVPGYESGLTINHINGIRSDNRTSNLEWVTAQENASKAKRTVKNRPMNQGSKHHKARLNESTVLSMRKMRMSGHSVYSLAKMFGVSMTAASYAIQGKTWRHI